MSEVQGRMRDVRAEGAGSTVQGVLDAAESSEMDIQDEIEFALIQMKRKRSTRSTKRSGASEEATYGYCFECGEEISERRLRALPSRVRCKDCEEARRSSSSAIA
jgi:DnaK suppressor protein